MAVRPVFYSEKMARNSFIISILHKRVQNSRNQLEKA